MILTLEVTGRQGGNLGAGGRKEFRRAGGSIGRAPDNTWVLPDDYVSSHHALVHYRNGQFLIEDTSSNGVFINAPDNRLQKHKPYPLQDGDRLYIDTLELRVRIAAEAAVPAHESLISQGPGHPLPAAPQPLIPDDPFAVDVPAPAPAPGPALPNRFAPLPQTDERDPLRLLGLDGPRTPPPSPGPRARDLNQISAIHEPIVTPQVHEREPFIPDDALEVATPVAEPDVGSGIPPDYDPLAPEAPARRSAPAPRNRPAPVSAKLPPMHSAPREASATATPRELLGDFDAPQLSGPVDPFASIAPPGPSAAQPARRPPPPVPSPAPNAPTPPRPAMQSSPSGEFDFAAFMEGAGLAGVTPSPELARDFGRIMRMVIAGLLETLRARQQIKEQFRMATTSFKPKENNPLKFSANVEDALHNLLVKHNAAFLGPVAAFEDAFRDVRNHQMAMLAGMDIAYKAMLGEFDPQRLQEQFDRQIKKGAILGAPARMRYWDLYSERFRDRVRDADACFRQLFGDEFAKAYEEQLEQLRTLDRSKKK